MKIYTSINAVREENTHTHTKVTVFNSAQCHTLVSITASLTKEFGPNTNQSPSITTWREKFAGQKWVAVNIWTLCHKVFTICSHRMKGVGEGGRDWLGRTHMSCSRTSREYHKANSGSISRVQGEVTPSSSWMTLFWDLWNVCSSRCFPPQSFSSLWHIGIVLYTSVVFFSFSLCLYFTWRFEWGCMFHDFFASWAPLSPCSNISQWSGGNMSFEGACICMLFRAIRCLKLTTLKVRIVDTAFINTLS